MPVVQWIEHQPSKLVMGVRFLPGAPHFNLKNMETEKDQELSEEEIAQLEALLGFGGCNCSNCPHSCGEEPGDFSETEK